MFSKRLSSIKIVTVIVFLSIVFIGLLTNWAKSNTDDAVINATLSEMDQIGVQIELLLEDIIEEGRDDLLLMAKYAANNNVSFDELGTFLKSQSQSEEFDTLYYIDLDGNGYSLDGTPYDFSDNESYKHALQNEFIVADPLMSYETDEMVFNFAVPVVVENEVIAVLFSDAFMTDFLKSVELKTEGTGDIFIIDHDLNLVFSTSENHVGTSFIPEGDASELGLQNISQAQSNFLLGNNGGFSYNYYGTDKVMVYFPIENTDWALAINVEVDGINATLTTAIEMFKLVSSVVYWIIIAMVFYISIANTRSEIKLKKTAYYDTLTGLPNLAKLKLDVTETLCQNENKKYSLIFFDIDNFKAINEMFGRDMGDNVLNAIKPFFESFNEPSLMIARIHGDRFAIFAGNGFLDDIRFLESFVDDYVSKNLPKMVGYGAIFKIGRYHIAPGETDFEDIIAKAGLAHARAKSTKGELFFDYDETFTQNLLTVAEITSKMKSALDNNEFKVYLQPKFSTTGNILVGAEALVRWVEDTGNMIYPNDFIPLFERNGFIVELDKYVLENVCMTISKWIDEGFGQFTISVNCSRLNLKNPLFVDGIIAIADKYNVPHECIEIELTESATILNQDTIEQLFKDLRKNGFKISIDDFGAGYSSLGMLKNLYVDTLKMDRSFFTGVKNAQRDNMLIDSIIKMSHSLGMYVVAEGIETEEQVELLKNMNCDAIQGYVYAKPMPINEFEEQYSFDMIENNNSTLIDATVSTSHSK